jgi:formamidopyrimidine-DNA glycosylase
MPELPEITVLARQMTKTLRGKRIADVDLTQPKCLNIPPEIFRRRAVGKSIGYTRARGKWLFTELKPSTNLLLNLGMGGDLRYHRSLGHVPEKYQLLLTFTDHSALTATFWWFGYIHLESDEELPKHKMTSSLGISPIEEGFTLEILRSMLSGRRGALKSFLLNQKNISGIGNVYIQDILFEARLHPLRRIETLKESEVTVLREAMLDVLRRSIRLGGLSYERDLFGRRGRYGADQFLVGYKEGKHCPACGTLIVKIKTGSTSSYICPKCQRLSHAP